MGHQLREVLPKAGLVYSEKSSLSEILSKPKILPLKSITLERIEEMETRAKAIFEEQRKPGETSGLGVRPGTSSGRQSQPPSDTGFGSARPPSAAGRPQSSAGRPSTSTGRPSASSGRSAASATSSAAPEVMAMSGDTPIQGGHAVRPQSSSGRRLSDPSVEAGKVAGTSVVRSATTRPMSSAGSVARDQLS
uniref:Uncharacterized protein n=1 Tax=Eutreptiella gymnastica TaxID=73025 RepID=A0A7S1HYN9_9EUGL|mmetsp:Transcript_115128/g.200376  ORF Transcript_115128/g.200376 Transcript_115128/m.200376 type:complete len:192 (+) Transcript_115128:102-677(+)